MKKYINKILAIIFFVIILLIILTTKNEAAVSLSLSPSVGEVEPGKSFSVTVRVSGGAGYVNLSASNATISTSSIWLDNSSQTISCVAGSNNGATITISANGVIADYDTEQDTSKSSKASVKINKKEEVKTPTQEPTQTPTNKKNTTTKTNTTKTETKVEETIVEDNFNIKSLILKGIKETGEQVNISLSPDFDKDVYEYNCNITSDIQKIEIEKDAGEYTNSIVVTGLEELKEGENIITLMLAAENHKAKTYTIKVIKEQVIETSVDITKEEVNEEKQQAMITMPIWSFILLQVIIIVTEIIILFIINNKILNKK